MNALRKHRDPAKPGLMCGWHQKGRPPHATTRFYLPGCPRCEEKLAKGLCFVTDPTPRALYLAEQREKSRKEKAAAALKKARAAALVAGATVGVVAAMGAGMLAIVAIHDVLTIGSWPW